MAENSKIEWCDATHNHWTRSLTSEQNRNKPYAWNKQLFCECPECGYRGVFSKKKKLVCPNCNQDHRFNYERQRVFCGSLMDWCEDRKDLAPWREDLLDMIDTCNNLSWLLLTKHPELIQKHVTGRWYHPHPRGGGWWQIPDHVWIGTTVEDQRRANERLPILQSIPARVRFVSFEPLLEPIDLYQALIPMPSSVAMGYLEEEPVFHWAIVGGESGQNKRPFDPDWARGLLPQVRAMSLLKPVAYFFKQMDKVQPIPDDLIIREFPNLPRA